MNIETCTNYAEIKKCIEALIDNYERMDELTKDFPATKDSLKFALEWFIKPEKSKGRKEN